MFYKIQQLSLNIIYVQKLTLSLNCQIVFLHDACPIQKKNLLKMIDQIDLYHGLYHIYAPINQSSVLSI